MELFDIVAGAPFWIAVLRVATPLIFVWACCCASAPAS